MGGRDSLSDTPLDDSGFDWATNENSPSRSRLAGAPDRSWARRNGTKFTAVAVVGLLVLMALVALPGQTVAQASFTANDVITTGNSGQLTSLTIAPEGEVHYDGLESEPSAMEVVVSVRSSDSSWETVGTKTLSPTDLEGSATFAFDEIDVLSSTTLKKPDFAARDGETESTDVDVRLEATLVGAGPDGGDVTTTASDTMTVSVTNEPAGANVGGNANSGGSAA